MDETRFSVIEQRVRGGLGRRIPPRPDDTPRTRGRKFRRFLEMKREAEIADQQRDDYKLDRRDRVEEQIDPVRIARKTEEALRQSTLFAAACEALRNETFSKELTTASSPPPLLTRASRPQSALSRSSQSSTPATTGTSIPRAQRHTMRASGSSGTAPPAQNRANNPYLSTVTTRYLERERAEKPYAIAHATTETLSVGLIDTLIDSWNRGASTVDDILLDRPAPSAVAPKGIVEKGQLESNMVRVTTSLQEQSERCRAEAFAASVEVKRLAAERIERMRSDTLQADAAV